MRIHSFKQFDHEDDFYTAEASSLRWPPGEIPSQFGMQHRSGEISTFFFAGNDGEECFLYRSVAGLRATVFND